MKSIGKRNFFKIIMMVVLSITNDMIGDLLALARCIRNLLTLALDFTVLGRSGNSIHFSKGNKMVLNKNKSLLMAMVLSIFSAPAVAETVCEGYGPQTPRDIDNVVGENKRHFSLAPSYQNMNLCNIHFHNNAEHKAKDFSIYAGEGKEGYGGGYQCNISKSLSKSELKAPKKEICNGLKPGDTIEVHWVHSSCDVKPGKGLGSCLSDGCANPDLRVETQVFTLVNDASAIDFKNLAYDGNIVNGYHQAKSLPTKTGRPIEFLGSTTGPKYTEQVCSPLQVSWSVRPKCAKLDIKSLGQWCKDNVFQEDLAHGVRKLVTNPKLLSEINK